MKRFGSLFPFVESGDESLRMGRFVANYEFLIALLNYSSFDEFHLYCLTPNHFNNTRNRLLGDNSIDDAAKMKVELFLYDQLEQNLAEHDYHCFHLGGWGYFWAGTVLLRNRCAKVPFPVTGVIHSLNSTNTMVDAHKLVTVDHQSYDSIVCTSESGREALQKAIKFAESDSNSFNGELKKIPLGYDKRFDSIPSKSESRSLLGIGQDDTVVLYLGRLSPTTKADLYPLFKVFKTLREKHGDKLKLVVAGGVDGLELRLHKDMISELQLDSAVRLMINFDITKKTAIYSAADICVAPSDNIQETFGISIVEAMAAGIPVVASDMDGYRELVQHNVTGLRVPTIWNSRHSLESLHELLDPGALQLLLAQSMVVVPSELESAIDTLIDQPELRELMSKNAKSIASDKYQWKKVIAQYEELWDELKARALIEDRKENDSYPFSPRYSEIFSHYTTELFSESMVVEIRPSGLELLKGGPLPPIYSDMSLVLEQNIISSTLNAVAENKEIVSNLPFKDEQKFQTTLLWMAKYDLIKLVSQGKK